MRLVAEEFLDDVEGDLVLDFLSNAELVEHEQDKLKMFIDFYQVD